MDWSEWTMRKIVIHAPSYLNAKREPVEAMLNDGWQVIMVQKPQELEQVIGDAEILVTHPCPKEIVLKGTNLKWLQALSVGVDAFPLDTLRARGVIITNGKGIHSIHMAEYALAAMVCLARGIHLMLRNQVAHNWYRKIPQGEINGAKLGILGLGTIGREVAKKADLMGMHVSGLKTTIVDVPHVKKVVDYSQIESIFAENDYIINLLPGTRETAKLIDRRLLSLMNPEACLINMGRGSTVNENDLIDILKARKIRAYWSDVFGEEPLPEDHSLWQMDNVIITPHMCGESTKYMQKAMNILSHNLKVYQTGKGKMMNVVDHEKGY
jgi:D-2-hydroxyacid dehydrogenase (NADP+)